MLSSKLTPNSITGVQAVAYLKKLKTHFTQTVRRTPEGSKLYADYISMIYNAAKTKSKQLIKEVMDISAYSTYSVGVFFRLSSNLTDIQYDNVTTSNMLIVPSQLQYCASKYNLPLSSNTATMSDSYASPILTKDNITAPDKLTKHLIFDTLLTINSILQMPDVKCSPNLLNNIFPQVRDDILAFVNSTEELKQDFVEFAKSRNFNPVQGLL